MALDFKPVEIVLEGLDQKTDARLTRPGRLVAANNVVFDKAGSLNKRRGYTRVGMDDMLGGHDAGPAVAEQIMLNIATLRDSLALYGSEYLYAMGSLAAALDGDSSIVRRGPTPRGHYTTQHVFSSGLGSEV